LAAATRAPAKKPHFRAGSKLAKPVRMNTKYSSVVIAIVLAGCAPGASRETRTSKPSPQTASTVAAATPPAPPPATANPAPAQPAPVAPAAPVRHASKLDVKRLTIARGVEHREPLDPTTSVDASAQKIYAFVELANPERLPGEITVEFQPPSKKYEGRVTLPVGDAARWRTWAFTRQAHEVGEWTAVVRDEKGHELARETFQVV
jgi:hypothetical protein